MAGNSRRDHTREDYQDPFGSRKVSYAGSGSPVEKAANDPYSGELGHRTHKPHDANYRRDGGQPRDLESHCFRTDKPRSR
jgi:hypothetical protein